MPRTNKDQVSAAVWLGCGVAIIIASLRYRLGTLDTPGTGFLPFLSGLAICILSALGLVHATIRKRRGAGWKPILKGLKWEKSHLVFGSLVAYVVLLKPAGFLLVTVFFAGFLLRAVKPQKWRVVLIGAVLIAASTYVIFEVWLQAQLPKGPWGM